VEIDSSLWGAPRVTLSGRQYARPVELWTTGYLGISPTNSLTTDPSRVVEDALKDSPRPGKEAPQWGAGQVGDLEISPPGTADRDRGYDRKLTAR